MERAGILRQGKGKVQLLGPDELAADWNPLIDIRLTVWEVTHQLIRALDTGGEEAAADILAKLGGDIGEQARDLAYRLYTICERKRWSKEGQAYNTLVIAWPAIKSRVAETVNTERQTRLI